jgi:FAD/FMN-containing dehydrogenase
MPVSVKSLSGGATKLDDAAIGALDTAMRGVVLQPESPGYDDARTIWNGMISRRPALIARCVGVSDVITCVNFARENDLTLSIKGGGHNIAGLALCDGGFLIDMSLMRGVFIDAKNKVANCQAGCVLGDVDRETQLHGLAAVLGFVSATGIAGLTLGGGFGYLTRRFGWTSDNVRSIDVVTSAGELVRASKDENADLFWALRGGGGNFGVAVNFEYDLYEVGPEIMGGVVAWPAEEAPKVLDLYRKINEDAPRELTCVAGMRIAPPAPWLPESIHGKPIVMLIACDTGPMDEAKARLAEIKSFGSPVGDVIQPRPYVVQQSLLDATQPNGRRYYWKSEYLSGHDPELLSTVIDHAGRLPSPHSAILLFPLDGALNSVPEDESAVGNRGTKTVINIAGSWESSADDEANVAWARGAWEDIRRFSTGGTYINFLNEEESGERLHDAYGDNYNRLIEVKTKWDPTNLFRMNKNIAPSGL